MEGEEILIVVELVAARVLVGFEMGFWVGVLCCGMEANIKDKG